MATIGQSLKTPEAGWKRYDDGHPAIKYQNAILSNYGTPYNGNYHNLNADDSKATFLFKGTKLRIISLAFSTWSKNVGIKIDGAQDVFSEVSSSSSVDQALVYEKENLEDTIHTVEIFRIDPYINNEQIGLDAIDIDLNGRMFHPDEVTDPKDLEIGKRIRCHYQASTGQVGVFSGLGEETSNFIPSSGSATPNGDFYYIMVEDWNGTKKLIADRNIQYGISSDTINSSGIGSGSGLVTKLGEIFFDSTQGSLALSNENKTVTGGNGIRILNSFKQTGKWYVEFKMELSGARIGIAQEGITFGSGHSTNVNNFYLYKDGSIFGGALSIPGYCPPIQDTDIVGLLLDLDEGTVEFSINGSRMGLATSDLNTMFTKQIYIYAGGASSTANTSKVTAYIYEDELHYPIPDNYHALGERLENEYLSTLKLLTGGTSATDKNNDWDKYIAESNLNGTITAGDNNVWNWKDRYTWVSSSPPASDRRVFRGGATFNNFSWAASSSTLSNTGFRPSLLIKSLVTILIKTLILSSGNAYKYDGNAWVDLGTVPSNLAQRQEFFLSNGMDVITSSQLNELAAAIPNGAGKISALKIQER